MNDISYFLSDVVSKMQLFDGICLDENNSNYDFLTWTECPTTDQLEEFSQEIHTMKKVGNHPHVVRLLGFCTLEQPYMMIMEYVPCGDLVS